MLTGALAKIQALAGSVRAQADQVAALSQSVKLINQQVVATIYAPAAAGQALVANLQQLTREVAASPRAAIDVAREFFAFALAMLPVPLTTSSRRQQAGNQAAMGQLVRATAVAEAANAAAEPRARSPGWAPAGPRCE